MEISFKITNKCNLNCSYCYQKNDKKSGVLTETKIINALAEAKNIGGFDKLSIYGGEAFLYPDIIDFIIKNFIKINGYYNEIFIYTNGTLFSDKIKDILVKYKKMKVQISLDGNEFAHNANRNGFSEIKENVDLYRDCLIINNNKVIFHSVWTKSMYKYAFDSAVFFFEELGCDKISPMLLPEKLSENESNVFFNNLCLIKEYCDKTGKKFVVKRYKGNSICALGKIPTITPDEVAPCHRFNFSFDKLKFSTLTEYMFSEHRKNLLSVTYFHTYRVECLSCKYTSFCYVCPLEQLYQKGSFARDLKCDVARILYEVFDKNEAGNVVKAKVFHPHQSFSASDSVCI